MKAKPQPDTQDELALSSTLAHAIFPGRNNLYVDEVAKALDVTQRHILNLIEEGQLEAVNVAGVNTNTTGRNWWRIPVSAFDAFVRRRHNLSENPIKP